MHFNKKLLIAIVIAFSGSMFVSCNMSTIKRPYTLSTDYASANLSDRKVVVMLPADDQIVIANKDDVADDLGGANAKPESRIRKFYFPWFFETLKSLVSNDSFFLLDQYRPGLPLDSLGKKEITLQTGDAGAPVKYLLPEKASLMAHGLDSTVLVIIERIEFKRNNFHMEYYWDYKSRQSANLEADAIVLVWDCKNDRPVFYGPLSQKVEFMLSMQRKHWEESARLLAKRIVQAIKCL
jgi:hypothetical protein